MRRSEIHPVTLPPDRELAATAALEVAAHRGGVEIIDLWAEAWRGLCVESANENSEHYDQPFYRPEWIAGHIRAFTPGAKVLLLTVTSQARLRFVLPLVEEHCSFSGVPVRRLRAPVNGHSARFDAVRAPGPLGDAAVQAAWDYLHKLSGWDVLECEDVLERSAIAVLARAARADGFRTVEAPHWRSSYISIPEDAAQVEKLPINAKLRSQLRQKRREIEAQGGLRLIRVETADRAAMDRFYALEASGWKGAEGTAIASDAATRRFYEEVAQSAERFGYLCLYFLEWNGKLLAAHFGLAHGGRYFSPKVAFDETLRSYAPGHLIVGEILKDCAARNIAEYDITGANDDWKMKWTAEARDKFHYFIFRPGLTGRMAHWMRFSVRPLAANLARPVRSFFRRSR
jgi:CelD/BcsL family acetyltransferase involved in cellulose biosynthesis